MSWNVKELDKSKTEQSITNETIRLEHCHEVVEKLIMEADQLRTAYEKKHSALCERIDTIKKSIESGEQFIEDCKEHLKDFEDAESN